MAWRYDVMVEATRVFRPFIGKVFRAPVYRTREDVAVAIMILLEDAASRTVARVYTRMHIRVYIYYVYKYVSSYARGLK